MSANDPVLRELRELGIDGSDAALLALLPLVEVAWADGEIQEEERALIQEKANASLSLSVDATHLLDSWLTHPPTPVYRTRGRRLLRLLASGEDLPSTASVLEWCETVARASGGFFGFRSVDPQEREALKAIADALGADTWSLPEDEDVEDAATDAFDPAAMAEIREDAGIATSTQPLEDDALAVLVHHGSNGGTSFPIGSSGLSLGRSSVNDIHLPLDHLLSRRHAKVVVEEGRFYLDDLKTTNGTLVNGERIQRRRLFGAEQIQLGEAHFTFLER